MSPNVVTILVYAGIALGVLLMLYAILLICIHYSTTDDNVRYVLTDSGKRALDEANGTCHTGLTIR